MTWGGWVIVALALFGAFLWGWFVERKPPDAGPAPGELKLMDDFDAKKKAEAERIAQENPNALLDDLNKPRS